MNFTEESNNNFCFYERVSETTERELDEFLSKYPDEKIDYWAYRDALKLEVKILKELAESTEKYGEQVDKLLQKHNIPTFCRTVDPKNYHDINQLNFELAQLTIVRSKIRKKLSILNKKHY